MALISGESGLFRQSRASSPAAPSRRLLWPELPPKKPSRFRVAGNPESRLERIGPSYAVGTSIRPSHSHSHSPLLDFFRLSTLAYTHDAVAQSHPNQLASIIPNSLFRATSS